MELQRSLEDFTRHGIAVFAVTHDPIEILAEFAVRQGITFALLSDPWGRLILRCGHAR